MKTAPLAQILIIDDDESMRFMLQTKLDQCGFGVTLAGCGSHAIQLIQTAQPFDLVLCDLKMPVKSGIDVIRYMKDNNINTPVLILTGFPEREKIIAAAQLGFEDVLVKPVRHNELMKVVRAKLGLADETQKPAA